MITQGCILRIGWSNCVGSGHLAGHIMVGRKIKSFVLSCSVLKPIRFPSGDVKGKVSCLIHKSGMTAEVKTEDINVRVIGI